MASSSIQGLGWAGCASCWSASRLMCASAVILAGGRGERLRHDKAMLELGGVPLLERQRSLLTQLSDDLIVVQRADQHLVAGNVRLVPDLSPYTGVLAGLAAGLSAARHPWAIVVACDMPFLSLSLLRHMLALREGYDIVVPRLEVGFEPLHALYGHRCLPPLLQALAAGQKRVVSFYGSLRVRYVLPEEIAPYDPLLRSFYNINTPEDLAQARQWIAG